MAALAGTVDNIYTKTITIKNGKRAGQDATVYHATVNGTDVNCGFNKPTFEQGEVVNLEVENKFGGWQYVGPAKQGSEPVRKVTKASPMPSAGNKPAFPVGKDTKDMSIIRQNSLTHATKIVEQALLAEIVQQPNSLEDLTELVISVAYDLTEFSSGHRELNAVMAQAKVDVYDEEDDQ